MSRSARTFSHAAVLKRRRNWRAAIGLLVALAGSSVYCSHVSSPPDARPLDGRRMTVESVVDGDTIILRTPDHQRERLRLRGIDAPELARDGQPDAYYATEARDYLRKRLGDGATILLQFDGTETRDRYGRLLAFVYLSENDCINLDLVRSGHAYADRRFTSFMQSQLAQAETDARKKKRGLWKDVTIEQMPAWRQAWLKKRETNRE